MRRAVIVLALLASACDPDVIVRVPRDCDTGAIRCYEGSAQTCVDGSWRDKQNCNAISSTCSTEAKDCGKSGAPCCYVPVDPYAAPTSSR